MAPFGLKLWENAFQTIPDISSFDVEKKIRHQVFRPRGGPPEISGTRGGPEEASQRFGLRVEGGL